MSGQRIAVIGAGMAGMSAAFRLQEAGLEPTVFESNDRVGGRIWTAEQGGYLMDLGAAVYLGTYRESIQTIKDVGLGDQLRELPAIGAMPKHGEVIEFDYSKPIRTSLTTKALSPAAKLKAIKLAFMLLRNLGNLGYSDYTKLEAIDNESTQEYSSRALSKELEEYATEPLVRGTWAADDRESSNALMLWSIRNMLVPTVFSLDSGMDFLARTIAERVTVKTSHPVVNVTEHDHHVEVTFTTPDGAEQTEMFDGAIIATTAKPALAMFPQMDANHRMLYESARYRGLVTVALGLNRAPRDRATYILIPRVEDENFIAVIADHIKAIGRAPAGKSMYTLLGSHEYLHRSWDRSDEEILADAIECTTRYHGGDVEGDVEQHRIVRWEEVVPVIDIGRFTKIARFKEGLDPSARVQLASDLDRIPGVNGALVSGWDAAQRIAAGAGAWRAPASVAAAAA